LACLRLILGEHVACGNDPQSVTSFADLLSSPEAIQAILQSLWERGQARRQAMPEADRDSDGGNTGQLDAVGVTLLMLMQHFPPSPDTSDKIRWLVSRVRKPPVSGMSRKNIRRIDQFQDPTKVGLLLNLPRQLMAEALDLRARRPAEAARLARNAIFFAIELRIPLRIRNLHTIRLGHNLHFIGAGRKAAILRFQAHETKNHRDLEYYVGPRLRQLLGIYLEHFLPFFAATSPDQATEQWLFPAGDGKPGPLSDSQVRKTIIDTVAERVGAAFHPHLFRGLAVEFALKHDASGHEHVRQLLGDESLNVVLSHYAPIRTKEAAEHQDRLVDDEADRLATAAPPLRRRRAARGRS
jgi:integrase